MLSNPTPTKPPKNIARPDPFAAVDKIDRALQAAPFHATAPQPATAQPAAPQNNTTQDNAPRDNAEQSNTAEVKPTHGNKVRVTAYMSVEDATSVQAMAKNQDRSDSYIAGRLIAEALEYRRAALRGVGFGATKDGVA